MRPAIASAVALSIGAGAAHAATRDPEPIALPQAVVSGTAVQPYVRVDAPVAALLHAAWSTAPARPCARTRSSWLLQSVQGRNGE